MKQDDNGGYGRYQASINEPAEFVNDKNNTYSGSFLITVY
jgi:hypothetical protein